MGCAASSPPPPKAGYNSKPHATVYPQQQKGQQPRQHVNYNPQKTEIPVRSVATTKDLLQQYINIENAIQTLESKNAGGQPSQLTSENQGIQEDIARLEQAYKTAKAKTVKEKGEYDDIFKVWTSTDESADTSEETNADVMKEKRVWIEAKGEEEVALKDLEGVKAKLAGNEAKMKAGSPNQEQLNQKYKEQEELLAAIFKGNYGSDFENKLEAEHDFLGDRQQRVGAAKYKWTNGRNLLHHATAQLCVACKKWMILPTMNPADQQGRYQVATEARNNVIAAAQNITSAKRYLNTIDFPYCKPEEVKVLENAAAHIYTDMQSQQRHRYVYANVYHSMYKRSKALVEWFSHVLASTIASDLKEANTAANAKAKELQQERLNLISIKIKEELQQDVQFEAKIQEPDQMSLAEDNSAVFEADGGSGDQNSDEAPPEAEVEADVAFNPVPLKELVQAPNKEDLFGDAQELYRKHQEDLEELEKNQMINKARQEQGLEEKLKARRSRRQRQAAIAAELDVQQNAEEQ